MLEQKLEFSGLINKGLLVLAYGLLSIRQVNLTVGNATMSINFSKALGIHEQALGFRAQRAEVLANNIANADTPHYKARDLDFASVLASQAERQGGTTSLVRTSGQHIAADGVELFDPSLRFRNPHHASIDQNTVDLQVEQSTYTENAVQFQASFTLLNNKFKGLMVALRGE